MKLAEDIRGSGRVLQDRREALEEESEMLEIRIRIRESRTD